MKIIKLISISFIYLILTLNYNKSYSQYNIQDTTQKFKTDSSLIKPCKALLANVNFNKKASAISYSKVEAALNFVTQLSDRYILIPNEKRDSSIQKLKASGISPTADLLASDLNACKIFFINISQIENIIRVELSAVNTNQPDSISSGVGYSLIHYRKQEDDSPIYDPTLVEAIQRAYALVEKDSAMFANAPGKLKILPAPTLVIGGIEYINSEKNNLWYLFDKKLLTSYDMIESIFEAAIENPKYVVYDIATRDTMYTQFNVYIPENYLGANEIEVKALTAFDVNYYITGKFSRINEGAELELMLCLVQNRKLYLIKSEKGLIKEDDLTEMRNVAKDVLRKLLE